MGYLKGGGRAVLVFTSVRILSIIWSVVMESDTSLITMFLMFLCGKDLITLTGIVTVSVSVICKQLNSVRLCLLTGYSFMKLFQIYSIFTKKFLVKKEDRNFISKFVIFGFSSLLFNVNAFKSDLVKVGRELLHRRLTELAVLLGEECEDRPAVISGLQC